MSTATPRPVEAPVPDGAASGSASPGGAGSVPAPTPPPRRRLADRPRLLAALGILLAALLTWALSPRTDERVLHPEGIGPAGGRALHQVLQAQGVEVVDVLGTSRLEEGTTGTVLVTSTEFLDEEAGEQLLRATATADRLVVVASPDSDLRTALGVDVDASWGSGLPADPECSLPPVREGDRVTGWATQLSASEVPSDQAVVCYPPAPGHNLGGARDGALVQLAGVPGERPETIILGLGDSLTNGVITEEANAALGLRLLGSSPTLHWVTPAPGDTAAPEGLWDVLPAYLTAWVVLGAVAVLGLALAQGRRLGAVVTEPLPAVVHATETTRSRGRLYRQAHDRGHALAALRAGAHERLAARLGLPAGHSPEALVQAVAGATGLPATEVDELLHTRAAGTDEELLALSRRLADLEVRARG